MGRTQSEIDRGEEDQMTAATIRELEAEVERLKGKLPMTKDGVAVGPNNTVWLLVGDQIEICYVQWTARQDLFIDWDFPGWLVSRGTQGPPAQVSESYGRLPAAEAARAAMN